MSEDPPRYGRRETEAHSSSMRRGTKGQPPEVVPKEIRAPRRTDLDISPRWDKRESAERGDRVRLKAAHITRRSNRELLLNKSSSLDVMSDKREGPKAPP